MVRVKIPQGVLSSAQLRVSGRCGGALLAGLRPRDHPAEHPVSRREAGEPGRLLARIAESGLTTREACSHTVRNVTGCPYAGRLRRGAVRRDALRRAGDPPLPARALWARACRASSRLPSRAAPDDCASGAINDIGLIAALREGRRGFRLLAGGGTATLPRSAGVLADFLPAEELLAPARRSCGSSTRQGERKNLSKARMKWIIRRLGWDGYRALYQKHFDAIQAEGGRPLPLEQPSWKARPRPSVRRRPPSAKGFPRLSQLGRSAASGRRSSPASPPRSSGCGLAMSPSAQLRGLATWSTAWRRHGAHHPKPEPPAPLGARARTSATSGRGSRAPRARRGARGRPLRRRELPGCRDLPHRRHRFPGGGPAARRAPQRARTGSGPADIKVSGCPNGCAQHHIATIGLQGGVRKVGGELVPQYHLTIGGGVDARWRRVRPAGREDPRPASARSRRSAAGPLQGPRSVGRGAARVSPDGSSFLWPRALLADLAELKASNARPEDFIDLGSSVKFEVVAMDGECAQ